MTFSPNDTVFFVTLVLMTLCALWAVMATDILKSALALALTSVFLSIAIFMLDSPLAAVFELSVCAGLITVVFISAISMIKPQGHDRGEDLSSRRNRRLKRYHALPIVLVFAGIILWMNRFGLPALPVADASPFTLTEVMWDERRADMAGQAIMILVGVFGVVVLFKGLIKGKEGE